MGKGGGVQIGKFQRGDNSCIGHHSFKCVFVASCFLALKSENEKAGYIGVLRFEYQRRQLCLYS